MKLLLYRAFCRKNLGVSRRQCGTRPPSTRSTWPVMKLDGVGREEQDRADHLVG